MLSRDFWDIGMHICNGRYRVNVSGYASGYSRSFRRKRSAMAYFDKVKDSCPFASVEDWWFDGSDSRSLVIARQDNKERFKAPPVLPNGERLPGYIYDARP